MWDDLLGDTNSKSSAASERQRAKNRNRSIGIVAAVVLAAVVGVGLFAMRGTANSNGTLVFDWPASDRIDTTVAVDNKPITFDVDKPLEYPCPAGLHHIVAERPAYKLAADVTVVAGQQQAVPADWKPKAVLVLDWPLELRGGAVLKIDGHTQTATQRMPLEIAVEPGKHAIEITRSGSPPIGMMATVAADGRELVTIKPPPTTAKLVFDWPAAERKDADLTVDGHSQSLAKRAGPQSAGADRAAGQARGAHRADRLRAIQHCDRALGRREPSDQAELDTRRENARGRRRRRRWRRLPQPVKKLSPPPAADQERIAKQLDDLYKTSHASANSKDPAIAQQLYDVAAKDGSSPAERFVLLQKGAEIAAAGGDLNLALQGIDTLDAAFEIDALGLKQKLLEKFIGTAKADRVADAIPVAEQLVDQAMAADQYETALILATAASHAVSKSQIPTHAEIENRLSRRRHEIRIIEPIYAAAKKSQEALDKNPADAEANLVVGRWRCFYKNDWPAGLPLLAKRERRKTEIARHCGVKIANRSRATNCDRRRLVGRFRKRSRPQPAIPSVSMPAKFIKPQCRVSLPR